MKSVTIKCVFVFILLPLFATMLRADEFAADSIIGITKRVANYHMKNGPIYPNTWDGGAYFTGIMAMHRLTKDPAYLTYATQWAVKWKWTPGVKLLTTLADDICCCQTYCEIYMNNPIPQNDSMIANVRTNLDSLFYVNRNPIWGWADAMYMAPPAVTRYCRAVNNFAFVDTMNRYYWNVSNTLYDTSYHLWYRDLGYKTGKAANGQPVFWSCGVAWVFGGMTRVLQDMPLTHPQRAKWITQFKEMAAAIKAEQGNNSLYNGLWTTSMRDHTQWPDPESSASSFFCFGMAWGINNHVLDSAQYIGCVRKAWHDLVVNVGTDGRLRRCQTVSWQPDNVPVDNSSVEGEAAFMLAGEELWKMATGYATADLRPDAPANVPCRFSTKRIVFAGRNMSVPVPANAKGVWMYDVTGRLLYRYKNTSSGQVIVPACAGTVLAKYTY